MIILQYLFNNTNHYIKNEISKKWQKFTIQFSSFTQRLIFPCLFLNRFLIAYWLRHFLSGSPSRSRQVSLAARLNWGPFPSPSRPFVCMWPAATCRTGKGEKRLQGRPKSRRYRCTQSQWPVRREKRMFCPTRVAFSGVHKRSINAKKFRRKCIFE